MIILPCPIYVRLPSQNILLQVSSVFKILMFEKYNTLKTNGQTIGYKIKVQALKYSWVKVATCF